MRGVPFLIALLVFVPGLPPAAAADEPRAGESAVALLAGLGGEIDESLLGTNVWTVYQGPYPLGEARLSVENRLADGRPAYGVAMRMRLVVEGGPTMDLNASALLTPDLRTLSSESVETETRGSEARSRVIRTARTGDDITVTRTVGDETKQWRIVAPPGLVDSGAEPLLLRLLSRRSWAEGSLEFLTRVEGTFLPLRVEAGGRAEVEVGGTRQPALVYTTTTLEFDGERGQPATGPDGRPRTEVRRYQIGPDGAIHVWEITGRTIRFERSVPPPETGSPIAAVSLFFSGLLARDAAGVQALFDWDAVFETWRAGPGAAETADRSPEQIAALRAELPARLTKLLIDSTSEEQRASFRLLANPATWTERNLPDGTTVVEIPEARRRGDRALATLRFRLRRTAEGPARILEIPGM